MPDLSPQARALAESAFKPICSLNPVDHALVVLGVGSGALIDRILDAFGPETETAPAGAFADYDTHPRQRIPIWVIEPDPLAVKHAMQRFDWARAVEVQQLCFFTGPDAVAQAERAVADPWSAQPTNAVSSPDASWSQAEIDDAMARVDEAIVKQCRDRRKIARAWGEIQEKRNASRSKDQVRGLWRERYREGNRLKVLCLGTRFATFMGHCMASLARGLERLGHDARLLQEPSDVHRMKIETIQLAVNEMDPDLIVSINYPRAFYERKGCCLQGIPYCCWMQDPQATKDLYLEDTRAGRTEFDFYFSVMQAMKDEIEGLGYGTAPIAKAPTDDELYMPGEPSPDEVSRFGCDVSCISTIDPDAVALLNNGLPADTSDRKPFMQWDAYHQNLERLTAGQPQLLPEDYRSIVLNRIHATAPPPGLEEAVDDMTHLLEANSGRLALRSRPLIWLSEQGYDLHLYGTGWDEHPRLSRHHRGTIPYGKPLASMLWASKMHLSTHGIWTLTMKVLDSLAAGVFPLVHWVDPRRDTEPITTWFEEDRDIVLFRTREELLDKARYYADHPRERQQIALRGREITLERFTYLRVAESMLKTVRERI